METHEEKERAKKGRKKKQTKTKQQKSPKISKAKRKDEEREKEEKEMEEKEEENAEKQKRKEGPCKVCQGTVSDRCSSKGCLNFLHDHGVWRRGRGKQTLSQLSVCIFFNFLLIFEGDCKLLWYKHL
jgi:ethanolamine ammonia-lyase small subunit